MDELLILQGNGTDPYRNLATEWVLTRTLQGQTAILYLWQNAHTIVVGRNQDVLMECRASEFRKDGGKIARRMSGGGAVYHDLGNLNFTMILPESAFDIPKQMQIIARAVQSLGIPARVDGRNDLTVEGKKFSGSAFYCHDGKAFHHGTILVKSNRGEMQKWLTADRSKLARHAVHSVESRTENLTFYRSDLTVPMTASAVRASFEEAFGSSCRGKQFTTQEEQKIRYYTSCFSAESFIMDRTIPDAEILRGSFSWGNITVRFIRESGRIQAFQAVTDAMDAELFATLDKNFTGRSFEELPQIIRTLPCDAAIQRDLLSLFQKNGNGES